MAVVCIESQTYRGNDMGHIALAIHDLLCHGGGVYILNAEQPECRIVELALCCHGRRNRGVQGVHVPPTFSGRGVQEGTLCESLCVSRCAVNGFVPF